MPSDFQLDISIFPDSFRAEDAKFLSWNKIIGKDRATILDKLSANACLQGDGGKATLRAARVACYPRLTLLAVRLEESKQDQFALVNEENIYPLTGENEPIYALNDQGELELSSKTVCDYVRLFFHFVRGMFGHFQIVEDSSAIKWKPGASKKVRAEFEDSLMPLTYRGLGADNMYHMTASVVFRDALLKTDILVASRNLDNVAIGDESQTFSVGQAALVNETLLIENLPLKSA